MPAKNDVTGDKLQTKVSNKKYRDNWDIIFNKKDKDNTKDKNNNDSDRVGTI